MSAKEMPMGVAKSLVTPLRYPTVVTSSST